MSLPPLANLFAVHRVDPAVLDTIAIDLEASGEFAHVWRPAAGWVAASAPLPGEQPDSATAEKSGFAFAEGRDLLVGDPSPDEGGRLGELADVADRAPERLGSRPGDFGLIRFRADGGATVVRWCGGLVPFYLWPSGYDLAISTRLGDFVRYLPEEPRLDPLVNAVWTTGHCLFPDQRTFLAGVTLLERGCTALARPGRPVALRRYWYPRTGRLSRPTAARVREHAERLRALLVDKLGRDLASDGGNLLTLSGGVDSSSLAVLAARVVERPIWTWSLLPGPEDLFQHEMSYIGPLASRLGIERSWSLRIEGPTVLLDLLCEAPRVAFHVIHPALCALPALLREAPVRVMFGGEFADEICGSGGTTPDWMAHTSAWALFRNLAELPNNSKDVLRWAKHRALEIVKKPRLPFPSALPTFVRPEISQEYREWFEQRRTAAASDHLDRRYLALCSEAAGYVTMNWEAASALNVRRTFPFFNREVLELAFECHPSELVGPGPKKLLRAALHEDVPPKNLYRPDKGGWGQHVRMMPTRWQKPLPDSLTEVICDDWFPNPPANLEYSQARGLRQLVLFTSAVAARRLAKRSSRE